MTPATPVLQRPAAEADAAHLLRAGRAVNGGTDVLVQRRAGFEAPVLVDLSGLRTQVPVVRTTEAGDLQLSALHPLTAIADHLGDDLPALRRSIALFASTTIRNRATIGGNLANGSPAADTVPPLLALDAAVDLVVPDGGTRQVPLARFLLGPRRVDLADGEWIRTVTVPAAARATSTTEAGFRKIGGRQAQAISFLNLAWQWHRDGGGRLTDVRLAMGAVAPTVVRLTAVERALEGTTGGPDATAAASAAVEHDIHPIDDLRASASYRRRCAVGLLREALGAHATTTRDER